MRKNQTRRTTWLKQIKFRWLWLALILSIISAPWTLNAAATAKPAIVLAAFGTTTNAFPTYDKIDKQVKERFPGYEIRWAFTSKNGTPQGEGRAAQRTEKPA